MGGLTPNTRIVAQAGRALGQRRFDMPKAFGAFLLGLLSFFPMMFIGEVIGIGAALAFLAVYFFVCQFLLSRKNPRAHKDWITMLALVAVPLAVVTLVTMLERREVILSQGLGILASTCGGTWVGAFAASRRARHAAMKP